MTTQGFSRLAIISAFAVALTAQTPVTPSAAAGSARPDDNKARLRISISPVNAIPGGGQVAGAGSQLVRAEDGVFMTLHTQGLVPGTVATAWYAIFNNPRECATSPCSGADLMNPEVQGSRVNAAGRIIGADGAASYGDFLGVGDLTGALDGPGLLNPKKAEIHLVVRTHGAASGDPAVLAAQLSMFNGGCPPNMCANIQASVHQP